ncbi:MAG: DNA-binding NarL/FixJ family response regulator [Flavobacteriales bacterium]|jgi:DNA-binding NarL/FixJ family response regulator
MSTSLIIAESSELFQAGIQLIMKNQSGIEVYGFANSNEELIELITKKSPDVVLIDYSCKNFSIKVVDHIKTNFRQVKFVGITGEKSANTVMKGVRHGIKSYVKKECSADEIVDSIIETGKGHKFFCGELLELMRNENVDVNNIEVEALSCEPVSLSDRELEIITLIAEGYTNAQIAVVLYISNHTVNTHRKNIMKKIGINNTAGIVMFAIKSGLVTPDNYSGLPELEQG